MCDYAGNALDELQLEETLNLSSLDRELETGLASSAGLLGGSAPVNIPGARSGLGAFSPTNNSPLQLNSSFLTPARFSQSDQNDLYLNHSQMPLSSSTSKINSFSNFFDFPTQNMSPNSRNHNNFSSISPNVSNNLEVSYFLMY